MNKASASEGLRNMVLSAAPFVDFQTCRSAIPLAAQPRLRRKTHEILGREVGKERVALGPRLDARHDDPVDQGPKQPIDLGPAGDDNFVRAA